ncbi:acyl-CoA dehydrogenase [Actinomadura sp. SCN-SB]|uniref:acyl-CoA dehydrogenase n=1 Tax=Actinomadura sp. SCN-SB TaxID=3373092 RepID=UPI0037520619
MGVDTAVADTEEQRALVEAIGELLTRHWPEGAAHKQISDPAHVSELPLWARLAEVGIGGLPVAESSGGSGGGWRDLAVVLEACGAAVAPVPAVTAAGAIGALESVSGARAAELLSRVAAGSAVPTFAWTERPGLWGARGGFTASDVRDGTVRLAGSADLVLTPEANVILLLADGTDGPVLAAVPAPSGGVVLDRCEGLDLLRPIGTLTLDGAEGDVLATGGPALAALRRSLVTGAAALAAELVGLAAGCLGGAVSHAADREQFGRPIGSFQAIKHKCADMLAGVELARAAARHLAERLDTGASPDELDDAAALALLETTRVARRASADYIQVLGGIGYTWEHRAHLYYRRAGAMAPLFGGEGAHRRRLDPTRAAATTTAPSADSYPEGSPAAELAGHVERLLPEHHRTWGEDGSFAARLDWQRTLHRVGWIAPHWAKEFGGRGLGIVDQVACDRVLADFRAPDLAGVLGVNNVAPTLMRYGTADQQRHLRAIQSGTEVWCQGFSEPGAGSDLAGLRTRAALDGDEFVINGQKVWTSEGMEATHCLLLARTDPDARPHRGISALLVPLDLPGITRRPIVQITGEGGFAEVFFDDVRVPRSALLGELHDGWNVTMTTLGFERAGVIMMAGRLEREVHDIVAGLVGRELEPWLRDALTDRLAETRLLGLLGSRALGRIATGGAPGAEHSVIKLAWSLAAQAVGRTRLDALGADGLRSDIAGDAQHGYLRVPATAIAGGTTEIMRNILAERVLGMPR